MFTSRAEYRLLLREDNADLRLREKGRGVGLVTDEDYNAFLKKKEQISNTLERLEKTTIYPTAGINERLKALGSSALKNPVSLAEILRRPEISFADLKYFQEAPFDVETEIAEEVEIQIKYAGYIERQQEQVNKFLKLERMPIPRDLNFQEIPGLTAEVREKLEKVKPVSLGQASRISGVTPAAISILMVYLKRNNKVE
jgi:tRNA uridine 5-carboxymethylaminomethyl modification enzyme